MNVATFTTDDGSITIGTSGGTTSPPTLDTGTASLVGPGGGGSLQIGDGGNGNKGDMSVAGTMVATGSSILNVGGSGLDGSTGDLTVAGTFTAGAATITVNTNGDIHNQSNSTYDGITTVNGRIDAENGAAILLAGTGSVGVGGTLDCGVLSSFTFQGTGPGWTIAANGTTQGNLGDGQFFIDGHVSIVSGVLYPQGDLILDGNGTTSNGVLDGAGSLQIVHGFTWNGGTLGVGGGTTITATADFTAAGGDTKELDAKVTNVGMTTELGGSGGLTLASGATFSNAAGTVGVSLPSIAGVGQGAGLFTNAAKLDLKSSHLVISSSFNNIGTLNVDGGDEVTLENIGYQQTFNLDGTLALNGDLILEGAIDSPTGFTENRGTGTLKVGSPTIGATLSLPSGATILGNLAVTATGVLTGAGQLYNDGMLTLEIGSSTAGLGSYQEGSSGTLDLQASDPFTFSSLTVTGLASLSGTLKMDFIDGYNPTSGTAFRILNAGSIGAHFDTTPSGMTTTYDPTGVTVTQN